MSFLGESNYPKNLLASGNLNSSAGFTLIELLVVIMMLSILITVTLGIINPLAQIKKSQDAERQHDLKQVVTALDSYYNDNNYYPSSIGVLITDNEIQAVPSDPSVSSSWPNYAFVQAPGNNPQWNVLFAKLAFPSSSSLSCPLEKMQSCLPGNYKDLGYNYCIVSGNVICSQMPSVITPLPIATSPGGGQPTSIPTAASTPTPTQGAFYCYCSQTPFVWDKTKGNGGACLLDPIDTNPNTNYNRYCDQTCDKSKPCSQ